MLVFFIIILSFYANTSNVCKNFLFQSKRSLFVEYNLSKAKIKAKATLRGCNNKDIIYELLNFMDEYLGIELDTIYKYCKNKYGHCPYFKAKIYEKIGNVSIAKNIYRKNGFYQDYIRVLAEQEQDITRYKEFFYLDSKLQNYYKALSYYVHGSWGKVVNTLRARDINSLKLVFLSLLKLGRLEQAKILLQKFQNDSLEIGFIKELLGAILLYAENKQAKAFTHLQDFLLYKPNDYIARKYLAQIYYRAGFFKKGDTIYKALLAGQWQATERFYLERERILMSILYRKYKLFDILIKKTINEYPKRKDLIREFAILLSERLQFSRARALTKYLKGRADFYYEVLAYINLYQLNLDKAIHFATLAHRYNKAPYYFNLKKLFEQYKFQKGKYLIPCDKFVIKKVHNNLYLIRRVFDSFSTKYFIDYKKRNIIVPVYYEYESYLNVKDTIKLWEKNIRRYWTAGGYNIVIKKEKNKLKANTIHINPWPSSFYKKRPSIDDWILLMGTRVAVHEFGHILGLDDEYIEHNLELEVERAYIGPMSSIMRNAISGRPEKRHFDFIQNIVRVCNGL